MNEIDNQFTFLSRRQQFEEEYFNNLTEHDILKTISVVDISTTDLCNRTCVFCPRHDPEVYPNRNLNMTDEGALIIASRLRDIEYSGTIAFSGFGENLLNPDLPIIVTFFRDACMESFIECNTNGDFLTAKLAKKLFTNGLDCLNINLYDGPEQVEYFNNMLADIPSEKYKLRAHWKAEDHGIIFNNRSGVIKWFKRDEVDNSNKTCYYPFYKLFIDWNGDVLFCANDWGRVKVVGNLAQQSIKDVWLNKEMRKVREMLAESKRDQKPCNTCNVNGTLVGKRSFDLFQQAYGK